VDLVAEKTIDEKIIKALKEKVDLANDVMVEQDIKKWLEF
jgi:hydroxylamine reductase (hybrid-cluster protein)